MLIVGHAPFFPAQVALRTALRRLTGWQPAKIAIPDQNAWWRVPGAHSLPVVSGDAPECIASLLAMDIGNLIQGPRDRGLVGKGW